MQILHVKINCIVVKKLMFYKACKSTYSSPNLSFTNCYSCVSKPVCAPFKLSFPVRGENSVSSVKGVEEGPGSEFESSLFFSLAKQMTIVANIFKMDKLQGIHGHINKFNEVSHKD